MGIKGQILPSDFYKNHCVTIIDDNDNQVLEITEWRHWVTTKFGKFEVREFCLDGTLNVIVKELRN